jgi:hypothetical protein
VTVALLDDHLLLQVLLAPDGIGPLVEGPLATTGLWYHRLGRALLASPVLGSMSRRLGDVDEVLAAGAVAAVTTLPDDIELVSLRTLAGPMARLVAEGTRLNLLSLEAVAAANHLGATIHLAADDVNSPLVAEAERRQIAVEVVEV